MGFGTSATQMVFFIAAIVVAAGVVGAFSTSVSKLNGGIHDRSDALNNELTTDIRIVNDPGTMPNDPLVLYVLNTGSRSLESGATVLLINGAAHTNLTYEVLDGDADVWRSGEVLKVQANGAALASGDHRVKVIVSHGIADTLRFSID